MQTRRQPIVDHGKSWGRVSNHMELEPADDDGEGVDAEPSLGSFDRMMDQCKSWRTSGGLWGFPEIDGEQDDCDSEDADPNECKLQPAVMT